MRWRDAAVRKSASRQILAALAFCLFTQIFENPARAQQGARPTVVDPRQTERNFETQQREQRLLAKPPPRLPRLANPAPSASTRPLVVLRTVSIAGAIAIAPAAFDDLYRPLIGKKISELDLVTLANAITERYRDEGYHLTRAIIPPQEIKKGRLRVQVIEGRITELTVKGDEDNVFGARRMLSPVLDEAPSRLATLERQLLIVNDIPGLRVEDTALEEIGLGTGQFRLLVKLGSWRMYTSLALDNWGTKAVGPLQAYTTTAFNSYLAPGDTFAVNLSTVPDDTRELRFGRLFYDVPIGPDGLRIGGSAARSEVWPGDVRRDFGDHTVTQTYELRGSITPLQTRTAALTLSLSAAAVDSLEKTDFGYFYEDHVRLINVSADAKVQDPLQGWNFFSLTVRQGLDVLGATKTGDPMASRDDASPHRTVLAYAYARYQPLIEYWSLKSSISGQFASGPLLNSQAYYIGGSAFGPGYYRGDNGFSGSVELRFDQNTNDAWVKGYQLYGFVDGGRVWDVGGGGGDKLSVASAGAGIRLRFEEDLLANFAVAAPVYYSSKSDDLQRVRFLFSVSKAFKWCPGPSGLTCG